MPDNLKWYGDEVKKLILNKATPEMITAAALLVEGQAKVNIRENGQIDTGFMLNSVYAVGPGVNSYGPAVVAGKTAAGPASPSSGGAVVGVAAEYAIYQEERLAYLYPALETVAGRMEGQIVSAGRKAL